jgi:tRNA 5-methylaminomethyl-2-thiouridine biosynthesis bifunctional protein
MNIIYDIAIIGAGIAGCMVANEAKRRGLNIVLIDRASTPATGGSGAAGAFISPKLGKVTPLLSLTNQAYKYATTFYSKNYSQYFDKSGILRLPKDTNDEPNFYHYLDKLNLKGVVFNEQDLKKYNIKNEKIGLFFKDGGVCDAQGLCLALIDGINYKQLNVSHIEQKCEYILIQKQIKAKKVVFATGYEGYEKTFEYMGINGIWGSRGDFWTKSKLNISIHKNSSISCVKNSIVKLGATHIRAKNPTKACMICNGEPLNDLIQKSYQLIDLKDLKLKETFCGMRSGSKDYFPLVGKVIDVEYMLKEFPQLKKGYNKAPLKYIENIYILNGFGGRGFVLAPLMAKWLIDNIVEDVNIDKRVSPDRLFLKWVRKIK